MKGVQEKDKNWAWRGVEKERESVKIPKTPCFLATDCEKIFSSFIKPNDLRKDSFDFSLFKLHAEQAS